MAARAAHPLVVVLPQYVKSLVDCLRDKRKRLCRSQLLGCWSLSCSSLLGYESQPQQELPQEEFTHNLAAPLPLLESGKVSCAGQV